MKKIKYEVSGIYIYAYSKSIEEELIKKGLFQQLVNRIILTS